jgi:hypothetical protein
MKLETACEIYKLQIKWDADYPFPERTEIRGYYSSRALAMKVYEELEAQELKFYGKLLYLQGYTIDLIIVQREADEKRITD